MCKTDDLAERNTHDMQVCLFELYAQGHSCYISGFVNSWKSSRLPHTYGKRSILLCSLYINSGFSSNAVLDGTSELSHQEE